MNDSGCPMSLDPHPAVRQSGMSEAMAARLRRQMQSSLVFLSITVECDHEHF